jgi:ribosomal protein L37AE/L43A
MSDDYHKAAFQLLIDMRGGIPGSCDFCEEPYTTARWPVPEEAGLWACSDCDARWTREDAERG